MRPFPLTATRIPTTGLLALACLICSACTPSPANKLEAVKRAGELVVLTRNSPTTYYEGPDGPTGLEYDLVRAFAERLGVSLRMQSVERFGDILPAIASGDADFAAAGITVTATRATRVRFAPSYQTIRQQVVYNVNTPHPAGVAGLLGRQVDVIADTSYVERLQQLKPDYPRLEWNTVDTMETEELLLQVDQGSADLTVADSNIVAVTQQFSPNLRVAFDLGEPETLAWAFPPGPDDSLYREAVRFLDDLQRSGELAQIIDRHYGAATRFNPINIAAYLQKIEADLRTFKPLFEEAGRRYLFDWRLIAALSYQESYWNPAAVSPTGVRGIMMLTETTARHLGVGDRLDPRQSILGGSAYLRNLVDRIPDRIPEPDRTWMALAAYNVGFNHLEDARIITEMQGGDPDRWNDLKDNLPLLAKTAWYKRVKHGYARGYEPVQFVTRIRTYYEVLKRSDANSRARDGTEALRLRAPAI
jgi:membrane-bound lytic murein transglycosylase F